jgi:hypothetical protein
MTKMRHEGSTFNELHNWKKLHYVFLLRQTFLPQQSLTFFSPHERTEVSIVHRLKLWCECVFTTRNKQQRKVFHGKCCCQCHNIESLMNTNSVSTTSQCYFYYEFKCSMPWDFLVICLLTCNHENSSFFYSTSPRFKIKFFFIEIFSSQGFSHSENKNSSS